MLHHMYISAGQCLDSVNSQIVFKGYNVKNVVCKIDIVANNVLGFFFFFRSFMPFNIP